MTVLTWCYCRFLTYNPSRRVTAEESCRHDFFTESPLPVDPSMFPTWPAKSEQSRATRSHGNSPKPPSGGKAYAKLLVISYCFCFLLSLKVDVTVWLQLFESCTGCQSLRGSSTSCACWFTSHFWDTRRTISQTFWHRLTIFQVDLHCVLHRVATSSCRGHVDELATEPFLLLHREHGTGYRWSWNCCNRRTSFVMILKHFCFILSMGSRIRIDSVMHPQSSSRGRNTNASVTVSQLFVLSYCSLSCLSILWYHQSNCSFVSSGMQSP